MVTLLDLPPEIRILIYDYVYELDSDILNDEKIPPSFIASELPPYSYLNENYKACTLKLLSRHPLAQTCQILRFEISSPHCHAIMLEARDSSLLLELESLASLRATRPPVALENFGL